MELHIGIDDTDSPRGGCTTFVAAEIAESLLSLGCRFTDYPNLVRLNPSVPWKTRGNGAVCLRVIVEGGAVDRAVEEARAIVEELSDLEHPKTDPAIAVLKGSVPDGLRRFAVRAMRSIIPKSIALKLSANIDGLEVHKFKEGGRGMIGAMASIGGITGDYTFELLAYRDQELRGTPRRVEASSVLRMDEETSPFTFNNIDPESGRILITPRGPDPVLFGIRGEDPEILIKAFSLIEVEEPIVRWMIFRTNQGTDAHLKRVSSTIEARTYENVILKGKVMGRPRVVSGGHVIFRIGDEAGEMECVAYREVGELNRIARELMLGDVVEVYGSVRPSSRSHGRAINVEKLAVLFAMPAYVELNPRCPNCGRRMKSAGRGKGYRCPKCAGGLGAKKEVRAYARKLLLGMYAAPARSQRHLTKPLSRYGFEKCWPPALIEPWHSLKSWEVEAPA